VGVPLLLGSQAGSHFTPTSYSTAVSGLSHNGSWSIYNLGTDRTENVSSIIACSIVAGATTCLQSCSLATAVILSPVYTAVTWQWIYMPQYTKTLNSEWVSTVCTDAIRNGFIYTCCTYTKTFPLCHILDLQRTFSALSTHGLLLLKVAFVFFSLLISALAVVAVWLHLIVLTDDSLMWRCHAPDGTLSPHSSLWIMLIS
jgi:hypothetical protein